MTYFTKILLKRLLSITCKINFKCSATEMLRKKPRGTKHGSCTLKKTKCHHAMTKPQGRLFLLTQLSHPPSSRGVCGNLGTSRSSYLETDSSGRDGSIWQEKHFTRFIIFYGRKHLLFHIIIFKELHKCPSGNHRGTII